MSARRESINKNDAKKPFVTKTSDTPIIEWALLEITCVWDFWKIILEGESRFSCKIRGNSFRGFSRKGEGKYWFSLIMYKFYSSNALYSACYQFTVFIFFNSFWYLPLLFQIEYQPSVTYKKAFNVFLRSPKHEEIKFPHKFIFVFFLYLIGAILSKRYQKWEIRRKNIKGSGSGVGEGELSKERWRGFQTFNTLYPHAPTHNKRMGNNSIYIPKEYVITLTTENVWRVIPNE